MKALFSLVLLTITASLLEAQEIQSYDSRGIPVYAGDTAAVALSSSADAFDVSPLSDIIPLSPQSSALARYGDFPVSHATGVPDITIPVYEIQVGGFTLPVSLSYHASGIKVGDVASTVGLGWTLNAGGAVTRQICGAPDLTGASNEYCDYGKVKSLVASSQADDTGTATLRALLYGTGGSNPTFPYDTQSDRYTFNFAGKCGTFRYSFSDKKFIPTSYSMMDIYGDTDTEDGVFRITDTDGTVYEFCEQEHTGVRSDENTAFVSAWYLTAVRTPYGDISIGYKAAADYTAVSNTEYVVTGRFATAKYVGTDRNGPQYEYTEADGSRYFLSQSEILYRTPVVSSISWRGGKVMFSYADDRMDVWKTRLKDIVVVNGEGDTVKSVSLGNGSYWGTSERNRRMMLASVRMSDSGTFSFCYDTGYTAFPDYPSQTGANPFIIGNVTCTTDYWGYCNGRSSRCSVPARLYRQTLLSYPDIREDGKFSAGLFADRTPDIRYAKSGTIKSIEYPTGGVMRFGFEANGCGFGGLRIRSITSGNTCRTFHYNGARPLADHPEESMAYSSFHRLGGNPVSAFYGHLYENTVCTGTPQLPLNPSCVFYTGIAEVTSDGDSTVYRYTCFPEPESLCGMTWTASVPQASYSYMNDYGNMQPYLSERTWYSAGGNVIRQESYSYRNVEVKTFSAGVKITPLAWFAPSNGSAVYPHIGYGPYFVNANTVLVDSVTVHVSVCELVSKETTEYPSGVSTAVSYAYDPLHRTAKPVSITVVNSDGRTYATDYSFAFSSSDALCRRMTEELNMYDAITGIRTACDGTPLKEQTMDYAAGGGRIYPCRLTESVCGSEPFERYRIEGRDSCGNIIGIVTNGCDTDSITWGYNATSPTAHRRNGVLTAEYSWKPLVGLTSVTEANGYRISYGYDAGGRLTETADSCGVMRRFSYSYANGYGTDAVGTHGGNSILAETFLSADGMRKSSSRQIFDGLGRLVCESTDALSEDGRHVLAFRSYDGKGRKDREWLPVAADSDNGFPDESSVAGLSVSTYKDAAAYSVTSYDAADRPVFVSTPGEAWNGRGKKMEYLTNEVKSVRLFNAPLDRISLQDGGYYGPGTLYGEKCTDEDGAALTVFRDRLGRKVLERRENGSAYNDTYFVYNALGQLRYVLSPEYSRSGYKDRYAYEYRYDSRGNTVKKILPGCGYTQYWYDRGDRMAFMQDATLRERGKYRFFLYDRLGRLAVQGTCDGCNRGGTPNPAEFEENSAGLCNTGYVVPLSDKVTNPEIETVNYYDTYSFTQRYSGTDGNAFAGFPAGNGPASGMLTGRVVKTSGGSTVVAVFRYDGKGRMTLSERLYAGKRLERRSTVYSYTGKPLKTVSEVFALDGNGKTLQVSQVMENAYSGKTDRLTETALTVNGRRTTVKSILYDALGRTAAVRQGGNAVETGYAYDLHGWTTGIRSRDFSENLHYAGGAGTPCYNGNISSMTWHTSDYAPERGYKFEYDALGRLREAVYGEGPSLADRQNRYNEKVVEYSANGAIRRFQRRGRKDDGEYGKIDNLHITLDGNRPLKVTDDALPANRYSSFNFADGADEPVEYAYNGVGALTKDLNRGITVEYDNLNSPRFIQFRDGNTILYDCAPDGTLLSKTYGAQKAPERTGSTDAAEAAERQTVTPPNPVCLGSTEYSGDIVYRNGKPDMVLFEGGYCTLNTGMPVFRFFTKDHLGNNRVVTREDGTVEQITHYYPFGGTFSDAGLNPGLQQYKYNGKPYEPVGGLDTYDYGARQYFPALPAWDRMDPMCEKYYNISPYAYCGNNPVRFVDIDGKDVHPNGTPEFEMIRNTLPVDTWQYVQLDESGYIDKNLINSFESNSLNYKNLQTLVNSSYIINVTLDDKFNYASSEGTIAEYSMQYLPYDEYSIGKDINGDTTDLLSTGEGGLMGKTLFPDYDGLQNSTDNAINIIINKHLSLAGAAEIYSHEANGHALLYINNGGNHKGASHQIVNIQGKLCDMNKTLVDMIINSKRETILNMKNR